MARSTNNALTTSALEISLNSIDWAAFDPILDNIDASAIKAVTSENWNF